jgi:hypothetical protein
MTPVDEAALSPALRKLVRTFVNAVSRDDTPAALGALSSTAAITLGDHDQLDVAELPAQLDGARVTKINGAGSAVAVSLSSGHERGIMFAEVAWRNDTINRIHTFPPDHPPGNGDNKYCCAGDGCRTNSVMEWSRR